MKKEKGFTLVELMATIVVLAIIIAIAMPLFFNIQKNIIKKNCENKVKLIETAAVKYREDTNSETMYVDDLIKNGYLDADDEKGNIYNDGGNTCSNTTKQRMNCYVVKTKEEAGMYYATILDKNYEENGKCPDNITNDINEKLKITMKLEDGNEFKYDKISKWWTNHDVILEATLFLEQNEEVKKVEWYQGYQKLENEEKLQIKVSTTSVLQQNYTVKVTLTNGKILNSTVRVYIDKINPSFYNNDSIDNTNWATKREYNIKAYDNESGLFGYELISTDDSCSTKREDYQKSKKNTFTENGKHKVCIMDNVGNIASKEITIEKVDSASLACAFSASGTLGNNIEGKQWYKSNIKLTLNSIKEIGPSGISLNITTENEPVYGEEFSKDLKQIITNVEENTNGTIYYGYIKNQANTTSSCSYTAYVEKNIDAPKIKNISTSYTTLRIENDFIKPISDFADKGRYCILEMDNISRPVDADTKGTCTYENINGPKTVEVKSCVESKAGNIACSKSEPVEIVSSKPDKEYLIEHDVYVNLPEVEGQKPDHCSNRSYSSYYCRIFNKENSNSLAQYCSEKDGKGECFFATTCSVTKFMELKNIDKVDTQNSQQSYFRVDKLQREIPTSDPNGSAFITNLNDFNLPCKYGETCLYMYSGRICTNKKACNIGTNWIDKNCEQTVGPYNFCDEGCASWHVTNFGEEVCGYRTSNITYDGNGNWLSCEAPDGSSAYYRDSVGNIHDWYLNEIN